MEKLIEKGCKRDLARILKYSNIQGLKWEESLL